MKIYKKRLFREKIENVLSFYSSPKFALIDLAFGFLALFLNPYRTCRKFLQKKGESSIYAYGETPLKTYEKIAREADLQKHDTWFEMGAGRGKGCFWLAHFFGCKVIAIEKVPLFYRLGKTLSYFFRMKNLVWENKDFLTMGLKGATIIYFYGAWPYLDFPSNAKIVTISEPLPQCRVLKKFWVRFPWGRTTAFLQVKKS